MRGKMVRMIVMPALGLACALLALSCGDALREPCEGFDPQTICGTCPNDIILECGAAADLAQGYLDDAYLSQAEKDALCEGFRSKWLPVCGE